MTVLAAKNKLFEQSEQLVFQLDNSLESIKLPTFDDIYTFYPKEIYIIIGGKRSAILQIAL